MYYWKSAFVILLMLQFCFVLCRLGSDLQASSNTTTWDIQFQKATKVIRIVSKF